MRTMLLYLVSLLAAGFFLSVVSPAMAFALPVCTNTTPTTTQCERPGNAQINTSPGVTSNNWAGWPWWWGWGSGITIGIGGFGI
jgi:hypothetical protein